MEERMPACLPWKILEVRGLLPDCIIIPSLSEIHLHISISDASQKPATPSLSLNVGIWLRMGVVQTLSYESWEFNMWDNIDAEHQYASIYYILFILLGPFILINVFIAGISSVFLQLRRKNEVDSPSCKIPSDPKESESNMETTVFGSGSHVDQSHGRLLTAADWFRHLYNTFGKAFGPL